MRLGRQRWRGVAHALLGLGGVGIGVAHPVPGLAQSRADPWNDARARALVALAIAHRSRQLSDSTLRDYRATAHGYLTFLAQVGPGFPDPPKVVRADELAVEVLWRAPNLSKQRIVGHRDTLLLPGDIGYYRDRYGIVQNNFPDSIGLGEGNDVRDVPHPLSPGGPDNYDYAVTDSLFITLPDRSVAVYAVRVRPRDPRAPRVVGTVYLERATGALVRMMLTFTRAAIIDRRIETLVVTLDNALVEQRFWLPHHQELEVERTGTWLDYPVRGIIRGRWQICCYQLNQDLDPRLFGGSEIVPASPGVQATYHWPGRALDSLPPDIAAATTADVQRVEETARALVRTAALARVRTASVSARGVSDFVRVNRVEGPAVGFGLTRFLGPLWSVSGRGRYGFDDRQGKVEADIQWQPASGPGVRVFAFRSYRDVADVAEGSLLVNSVAAQEFGADHTDPFDTRGFGLQLGIGERFGFRWSIRATRETQRALSVHSSPANGQYGPTIPALALQGTRVSLAIDRPPSSGAWGIVWRGHGELRGEEYTAADTVLRGGAVAVGRAFLDIEADRAIGAHRLIVRAMAAGATAEGVLPPQEYVYGGGPVSGPGYSYHTLVGRAAGSARVEWQLPIPGPAISLGRLGRAPAQATLAPFVSAYWQRDPASFRRSAAGWYPAVGLGCGGLFDLARVDIARGLGRNGLWALSVDVSRDWWGIL